MFHTLKVQILDPRAFAPTVGHKGDSGYDLYALENTVLLPNVTTPVRTGIAAAAYGVVHKITRSGIEGSVRWSEEVKRVPYGLRIEDRSSMAAKGITKSAGILDSGYRGEIKVLLTSHSQYPYTILAGDKIAQMVPHEVLTGVVEVADDLGVTERGEGGFGSTGR
jgi:dUTP pyrophosphatase